VGTQKFFARHCSPEDDVHHIHMPLHRHLTRLRFRSGAVAAAYCMHASVRAAEIHVRMLCLLAGPSIVYFLAVYHRYDGVDGDDFYCTMVRYM
jgi:hypothetical protein